MVWDISVPCKTAVSTTFSLVKRSVGRRIGRGAAGGPDLDGLFDYEEVAGGERARWFPGGGHGSFGSQWTQPNSALVINDGANAGSPMVGAFIGEDRLLFFRHGASLLLHKQLSLMASRTAILMVAICAVMPNHTRKPINPNSNSHAVVFTAPPPSPSR